MTQPTYDQSFWEQLWSKTLREHADKVAQRPPNRHLVGEVANLRPGRALDAGCGHGTDALWLATHGWQVSAVDFSASALAHGRSMAEALGPDVSERIVWALGDLATWSVPPSHFELVVCLYVHVAGQWQRWCEGWRMGSPLAVRYSWLATARSIPRAELPRPQRVSASLGRKRDRRARSTLLGIARRRGAPAAGRRQRGRRRDPCATLAALTRILRRARWDAGGR